MSKFIAIHPVDPPASMDSVVPVAKKAKAGVTTDAYWVKSWCKLNNNGEVTAIYCEWDGKDAQSVRDDVAQSIPELPGEVSPMAEIQGEDFR